MAPGEVSRCFQLGHAAGIVLIAVIDQLADGKLLHHEHEIHGVVEMRMRNDYRLQGVVEVGPAREERGQRFANAPGIAIIAGLLATGIEEDGGVVEFDQRGRPLSDVNDVYLEFRGCRQRQGPCRRENGKQLRGHLAPPK